MNFHPNMSVAEIAELVEKEDWTALQSRIFNDDALTSSYRETAIKQTLFVGITELHKRVEFLEGHVANMITCNERNSEGIHTFCHDCCDLFEGCQHTDTIRTYKALVGE